jgi:FecR protein
MKTSLLILALFSASLLVAPRAGSAQNLIFSADSAESSAIAARASSQDDDAYADGVRAVNNGRWSDAVAIFSRIAAQGGGHAEGALYWKAYAENKQGQSATALETCGELRHSHPESNWIDDCGALEIEIHSRNGQPVQPNSEQSDELKLLALASLMQNNENKALAEIDQILNSDESSEKLKQGALYIMGEHHSDATYPQIARLSLTDGDVRVARGIEAKHRKDTTWEVATSNLPLEPGYSLVTGDGRAEIELEDASTLYLAPNSVLTINDLSSTGGIPHTEMALLSGTVTLHVHPYVAGETFTLRTPSDNIVTRYPQIAYFRISSYTDGMAFTPMSGGTLGLTGASSQELIPGQTIYFKDGRRVLDAGPISPPDFTSWDQWVADRTAVRSAQTIATLKASGLSTPIPGLADLAGQGTFFSCEPYGTCWEPNGAAAQATMTTPPQTQTSPAEPKASLEQSELVSRAVASASPSQTPQAGRNIQFVGPPAVSGQTSSSMPFSTLAGMFPCVPDEVRLQLAKGATGNLQSGYPVRFFDDPLWTWAVCHSGSWLYRGHRYVWVVGRRHHHQPFHWIKSGRTIAYVPLHPHDVKDRPPINRMGPVFAINNKNGHWIEPVKLETATTMQLLKGPPREFRDFSPVPLVRASEPSMEAHSLKDFGVAKGAPVHTGGVPITFDSKSQNFMMPREVLQGGRPVSVLAPISNRLGDLQAHSGLFGGGGSYASSYRNGGYGSASSHGAAGGGGHSGGTGSGGSGSHGGASSGSASASSGGGSSASSSGGGHK